MRNLTRIIGPAPSEMDLGSLVEKLRVQRKRIVVGLEEYAAKASRPKKPKKRKSKAKSAMDRVLELKAFMDKHGLKNKEELAAFVAKQKEETNVETT